jgi:peptidoglycan DL-endopeptidase LytF
LADRDWRAEFKRYGAPAAFLAAVTIAVLLVRAGLDTDSSANTTTATTTRVASTSTATTTATSVRRRRYYRLRQGETISDVAIRFDTTVEQLLALNPGIEPNSLDVGQRIRVR